MEEKQELKRKVAIVLGAVIQNLAFMLGLLSIDMSPESTTLNLSLSVVGWCVGLVIILKSASKETKEISGLMGLLSLVVTAIFILLGIKIAHDHLPRENLGPFVAALILIVLNVIAGIIMIELDEPEEEDLTEE